MPPKICPNCGTPQQWEIWRRCLCGHDFGPPSPVAIPVPPPKKPIIEKPWTPPTRADLRRALLLATIGCALLLSVVWKRTIVSHFAGVFLIWSFVPLAGPPAPRPMKWRDWLIMLGTLAALVIASMVSRHFPPPEKSPAGAITLWAALMIFLSARWRWLRRKTPPNIDAKAT